MAISKNIPQKTAKTSRPVKPVSRMAPVKSFTPRDNEDYLSMASNEVFQRGRRIIFIGDSKLGKTSFAAQWPSPIFVCDDKERGLEDLKVNAQVDSKIFVAPPVTSWDMLIRLADQIATDEHAYGTAVFESITGFEQFCFQYCCEVDFNNNWTKGKEGFYNFYVGPKTAAKKYWPVFLDRLEAIANRGIHVILTGHTSVKSRKTTGEEDYVAEVATCDKELWAITHKWAEAILVMAMQVPTVNGKVSGSPARQIFLDKTGEYDAGNRYGLTGSILCSDGAEKGYQRFCQIAHIDPSTGFFV